MSVLKNVQNTTNLSSNNYIVVKQYMNLQWSVVHFFNDDFVEPVPSYWINKE